MSDGSSPGEPTRPSPVVRLADVALSHERHGTSFEAHLGRVAAPVGARHLGMRLCVVPPGKSAWPFHCHHANDEAFVILDGEGTLCFGADAYPFRAGDVLVCPASGPETAHRLTNTGLGELRYLAVSSMREPDVMEYPASGKWGAFAGAPPDGDAAQRTFSAFVRADARVDYWAGEANELEASDPGAALVDRLGHLVLTVPSIERTCAFYADALAMRVVEFARGRVALVLGSQKINLHEAGREFEPKALRPTPGSADLCLIVAEPVELLATRLAGLGVVEEGPVARTGAAGPLRSI